MSSRGNTYRALLAALAGILLFATALSDPAQAAIARTISITANPNAAYGGTTITYSGATSHSGAGYGIKLQRKVGGTWATVTSTVTRVGGKYSLKATLCKNAGAYQFRTAAVPSGNLGLAYSRAVSVKSLGFGGSPGPTCSS